MHWILATIPNQTGALAMTRATTSLADAEMPISAPPMTRPYLPRVTGNEGYTGHEELPDLGLIHMNGRVYDSRIGRVLSADPIIPTCIGMTLNQHFQRCLGAGGKSKDGI